MTHSLHKAAENRPCDAKNRSGNENPPSFWDDGGGFSGLSRLPRAERVTTIGKPIGIPLSHSIRLSGSDAPGMRRAQPTFQPDQPPNSPIFAMHRELISLPRYCQFLGPPSSISGAN